ncbi:Wzz/FepE/Etk N-terminal domain-containing protein [Mesobacillus maritimus]|uniref:YveK family protein n=1 Tax=Mesobacillus maritimus TaxID=1643336 RepID=UPI00203DB0B7|nr:Wzz/FepE/Etk N-terminal domain-containing protein [Mesobacillus maritimus]MCM3586966.1 Wzz/FepE/Etk N-terminal domain-containing protein [Mesobacillus maritimus]
MEETISLKELLLTLKKRMALIIAITLTAVIISGVVSFFLLTPIYQASTQLLVNQKNEDQTQFNSNQVQTNLQLINTYNVIIKSPAILDLVAKELGTGLTSQQLNGKITVGSEADSQVVNISVQDENPQTAAEIANTIATVFSKEIVNLMNIDNVSILSQATVTDGQAPIKPQPVLNIAIALVVGLMAGVGLAFLLEYFDNTVKNEQDIEKTLGMPILGVISVIDDSKIEGRAARKSNVRGESIGS